MCLGRVFVDLIYWDRMGSHMCVMSMDGHLWRGMPNTIRIVHQCYLQWSCVSYVPGCLNDTTLKPATCGSSSRIHSDHQHRSWIWEWTTMIRNWGQWLLYSDMGIALRNRRWRWRLIISCSCSSLMIGRTQVRNWNWSILRNYSDCWRWLDNRLHRHNLIRRMWLSYCRWDQYLRRVDISRGSIGRCNWNHWIVKWIRNLPKCWW